MLSPTEGVCKVLNVDPYTNPVQIHQFSGVLTEHAQMYGNMTGLQNLVFFGSIFGLNMTDSNSRALDLLAKLELTDAKDRKLETYSTGMRQRLSLARAMIHRPKILFLDEPTSGLDPENAMTVNNLIKDLAQEQQTTIFLCTHQLRYAQEICTSYGLIDEGKLFAQGTIKELRAMVNSGYKLIIKSDIEPINTSFEVKGENTFEIDIDSEADVANIISNIVRSKGNVFHASTRQLSLEEIYFALTRHGKGGIENG
jgi:ABC-2 type transport system ATP-binding protein